MTGPKKKVASIVRAFIAIGLPVEVRDCLVNAQRQLRTADAHVSWVPEENLHLSLVFLGNTFRATVEDIADAFDREWRGGGEFPLAVRGIGTFGKPHAPRVVWAGIEPSRQLSELHRAVMRICAEHGFATEDREYSPHITLGRVRSRRRVSELVAKLSCLDRRLFGECAVRSIRFMKSELQPHSVRHTLLRECRLIR